MKEYSFKINTHRRFLLFILCSVYSIRNRSRSSTIFCKENIDLYNDLNVGYNDRLQMVYKQDNAI